MEKLNVKRSISVISTSEIPTGDMVRSTKSEYPDAEHMIGLIKEFSKKHVLLNATELSEHFFGSNMQANFIVIGAAYQSGAIPIDATSIEEAININGVAIKNNTDAFNIGRTLISDPSWIESMSLYRTGDLNPTPAVGKEAKKIIDSIKPDKDLRNVLEYRIPELIDYQNIKYAKEYAMFVKKVYKAEKKERSASILSQNVAKYLFKLMATKDEYEVARLSLKAELDMALSQEFGTSATVHYMLHPPFLKGLANIPLLNRIPGVKSKLALGSWFRPFYMLLKHLKFIRGTRFDLMARFSSDVRKADREVLDHYKSNIINNLSNIGNGKYEQLISFSVLPDHVRGYEEVRLESMKTYYHKAEEIFKS